MPTPSSRSFAVTPLGCSVTLTCGVRLRFPAGATATPVTVRYRLWLPEPRLVPLGPHDSLLSGVLELQPHGVAFQQAGAGRGGGGQMRRRTQAQPQAHTALAWQEVGLWLLFVPPRARRCREVVVRTLSDNSWSDLETHLEEEAPKVKAVQRELCPGPTVPLPPPCPSDPAPMPSAALTLSA